MTDKVQKIRAEVERLIVDYNKKTEKYRGMNEQAHQYYGGKRDALSEILKSLDSMQEEPVSEDKMTISKGWFEHCKKSWYNEGYIDGKYNRDRQFEEPVSEDLDEAAIIYARGEYDRKNPSSLPWQCKGCYSPLIYAFKDGAQWQKQQDEKELLHKKWDETTIKQWFIANVDKHEPIWTDAHIEELCKDFILIKKGE